jgi:DNA-binding MarR family transcriptional regulator
MSAGAVSTNVRVLEGLGLVERVTFPRDRATYYRVAADAWDYLLDEKQRGLLGFRRIAEEGAAVLEGTSPERAARLEALIELLDFMDVEYPKLVERWHTRKEPR